MVVMNKKFIILTALFVIVLGIAVFAFVWESRTQHQANSNTLINTPLAVSEDINSSPDTLTIPENRKTDGKSVTIDSAILTAKKSESSKTDAYTLRVSMTLTATQDIFNIRTRKVIVDNVKALGTCSPTQNTRFVPDLTAGSSERQHMSISFDIPCDPKVKKNDLKAEDVSRTVHFGIAVLFTDTKETSEYFTVTIPGNDLATKGEESVVIPLTDKTF